MHNLLLLNNLKEYLPYKFTGNLFTFVFLFWKNEWFVQHSSLCECLNVEIIFCQLKESYVDMVSSFVCWHRCQCHERPVYVSQVPTYIAHAYMLHVCVTTRLQLYQESGLLMICPSVISGHQRVILVNWTVQLVTYSFHHVQHESSINYGRCWNCSVYRLWFSSAITFSWALWCCCGSST